MKGKSLIAGVGLIVLGLAGVWQHIEYSGWVLLVGCLVTLDAT